VVAVQLPVLVELQDRKAVHHVGTALICITQYSAQQGRDAVSICDQKMLLELRAGSAGGCDRPRTRPEKLGSECTSSS
jgi:hypothetical protein